MTRVPFVIGSHCWRLAGGLTPKASSVLGRLRGCGEGGGLKEERPGPGSDGAQLVPKCQADEKTLLTSIYSANFITQGPVRTDKFPLDICEHYI